MNEPEVIVVRLVTRVDTRGGGNLSVSKHVEETRLGMDIKYNSDSEKYQHSYCTAFFFSKKSTSLIQLFVLTHSFC